MDVADRMYMAELTNYYRCCECGYVRNGAHHPGIQCPKTKRCGTCGNDWPCHEHLPMAKGANRQLERRKE